MKKIKGLLLFGILTLLGIGSSFGTFFDLRDNTGSQLLIPNYSYSRNGTKYYSTYNYTLGTSSYHSGSLVGLDNRGVRSLYVCRDSNLNILGFSPYAYIIGQGNLYTFPFGDFSNCSSFNELINFEYLYIRNDVSISPYSLRKDGPITRYLYFDDNNYYIYSGNVNDVPSGYTRQKLFLSVAGNYGSVSSDSSGNYLLTSLFDDSFSISNPTIYSGYILLHFGGYDSDYYNGAGTLLLSLGDNVVYFNYYTGFYKDYSDISLNTPSLKGVLLDGSSSSDGYTKFINFLNNGDKIVLTYGSISNGLSFNSYGYNYFTQTNQGGGYFTKTTNYFFNFQSDDSIPTFIIPSGNGNQSTGSIAINTGFLDLCLNNLQFGELNSYLCNKLFNGNNLVLIPGQTGYYLSYGYDENGNLRFWITYQEDLEEQMSGYIREQDENGNWYTYLPEEINTGIDNSNGLKDYFNNWFEHGVFFSCPFHYTDSYYREFKLFGVTHFVPKLGQSFLYPIYCMGAGFREGKNIEFFSGLNLGLESQLLSSPDYNYLYRLFDLILSVLIMFFIIKIYHLLN